jgi:hypothetical protein
MHRRKVQEAEHDRIRFEEMMMVNNPAMYQEYNKQKQEEITSGNSGVTWIAPESAEEVSELLKVFSDIDEQMKSISTDQDKQSDIEFIKNIESMNIFEEIDIDQIGI